MPALKVKAEEIENRETIVMIESYMTMAGIKKVELASKTVIPYSTLAYRFRNPDSFTRAELRRICKVLKIPRESRGILV